MSQSPSSRDPRELEKAESCEWALPVEAGEMANSHINNESLETIGSLSPSRTISQDPEDWSLSPLHYSATGVILKDCATEHSSEVLLAADILASRAS